MKNNYKEPIFNLRVSERTKYEKEGKWFKEYINYLVPYDTVVVEDYDDMKLAYDIVNNDIRGFKANLDAFCNPLGEEQQLPNWAREEVLPYNKLHNKVNVQAGELLKRSDNHKIALPSPKAIHAKDNAYKKAVRRSIEEAVELEIELLRMQMGGASERELQDYRQEMTTQMTPENLDKSTFLSESEIFYSHALNYCNFRLNLDALKQTSLKHALIADRAFFYVGWEFGEPIIRVLNPLHCGFHKSPDVEYVQHGDYFWHKRAITIADCYNKYGDKLSEEEMEQLGVYNYANNHRVDKRHSVVGETTSAGQRKVFQEFTNDYLRSVQDKDDKRVGQFQGSGTSRQYYTERLVWETHIEFKAYREVIFLTYTDDYNKEVTKIVPSNFEIPENAVEYSIENKYFNTSKVYQWSEAEVMYSAEKLWIPRRYEVTRLGPDIYVDYREVPNQPINIENPYKEFELSYKGKIFTNLNSKSISPVQRAIPLQFQYFYIKHIQNRELAKYQGYVMDIDIDQIPDYFELDHEGERIPGRDKTALWSLYLKKQGRNYYSGSQTTDGTPVSTRSPGTRSSLTGNAADLLNLAQLADYVDREISMTMGISPQREAGFTQGSNVSDNQQAITQSHHITEPFIFMHSECWKHVLTDWLRLFRAWAKKIFEANPELAEHSLMYITPSGAKELFKITPDMLDHQQIGLYVSNSGNDATYREVMTQHSFAFAQNAGEGMESVSSLIKAITSKASPEEIHKMIQIEGSKQAARQERLQQMQAEQEERALQRAREDREDVQRHEIQRDISKEQLKGEYKLEDTRLKMSKEGESDQDGIASAIENAKVQQDMVLAQREQNRKEKETEIKAKQVNKLQTSS